MKRINEAVVKQQRINDYMELHGGKEPPESSYTKLMKALGLVNKKKVGQDGVRILTPYLIFLRFSVFPLIIGHIPAHHHTRIRSMSKK